MHKLTMKIPIRGIRYFDFIIHFFWRNIFCDFVIIIHSLCRIEPTRIKFILHMFLKSSIIVEGIFILFMDIIINNLHS